MEGYAYGAVAPSPVTAEMLDQLKASVLFGPDDVEALAQAGKVLDDQIEDILDVWYGFVGAHPFLIHYFSNADGPMEDYLARVRARFGQWIRDTCQRPYDAEWLAWQAEIARRHTRAGKNETDGAHGAPPVVPLRYLISFIYPISATMRPFLARKGHADAQVEAMWQAWFKAVTLQVALWSYPYADGRDW